MATAFIIGILKTTDYWTQDDAIGKLCEARARARVTLGALALIADKADSRELTKRELVG